MLIFSEDVRKKAASTMLRPQHVHCVWL